LKTYNQFCPLAQATQILCERWTLIVIREFIAGSTRFSELKKGVPTMSPTLLSTRLKQLVNAGVLEVNGSKGAYTYNLTEAGKELRPVIELLGAWGHRWSRSDLNSDDLDAGLLMWDMRRSINPEAFPNQRIVVQFEYPDAPKGGGDWWLVSENGSVDLCLNDHGYEIDVLIKCSLKAMTKVWICERTFNESVKSGEISVMGDPKLTSKLQNWLCASPLSTLGTKTKMPQLDWNSD